jgi:hypothetical protein
MGVSAKINCSVAFSHGFRYRRNHQAKHLMLQNHQTFRPAFPANGYRK